MGADCNNHQEVPSFLKAPQVKLIDIIMLYKTICPVATTNDVEASCSLPSLPMAPTIVKNIMRLSITSTNICFRLRKNVHDSFLMNARILPRVKVFKEEVLDFARLRLISTRRDSSQLRQ